MADLPVRYPSQAIRTLAMPRMALLQLLVLASLMTTSGWSIITPVCPPLQTQASARLACRVRMQEAAEGAAEPAAATAEDAPAGTFTEELLDAIAAEDAPLSGGFDSNPVFLKSDNPTTTLEPSQGYTNAVLVEEARQKYKMHETDSGSSQVQIAVLTARISYMTSHMQKNKKDYASLRGLTAMVTRRRKLLEYLLRTDVGEFERLTSELNIRTNQLLKPKLSGARGRRV